MQYGQRLNNYLLQNRANTKANINSFSKILIKLQQCAIFVSFLCQIIDTGKRIDKGSR